MLRWSSRTKLVSHIKKRKVIVELVLLAKYNFYILFFFLIKINYVLLRGDVLQNQQLRENCLQSQNWAWFDTETDLFFNKTMLFTETWI